MPTRKRVRREKVIVVLDGLKASKDERGVASLRWVFRNLGLCADDDLLVLVILNPTIPYAKCCCLGDQQSILNDENEYLKFLHEQIGQRRKAYLEILRPFYQKCKICGVKFEVKVFAGCETAMIITPEAIKTKATWIVMDRGMVGQGSLQLGYEDCKIVSVNENAEAESQIGNSIPARRSDAHRDVPMEINQEEIHAEQPEVVKESVTEDEFQGHNSSIETPASPVSNPSIENCPNIGEEIVEERQEVENSCLRRKEFDSFLVLNVPMELNQEEIQITTDYGAECCEERHAQTHVSMGYLANPTALPVLVRHIRIDLHDDVIEAEKRVSRFMFHKNILAPIGFYHESRVSCALVYMYSGQGSLDQFLSSVRGRASGLTCAERMKIAIETSSAIRYMHDECPRGPVVHGNLRPCNIYLGKHLEPQISGFGRAKWLETDRIVSQEGLDRCSIGVLSHLEAEFLVKGDVYSFGVLLLRLFCRTPLPEDDMQLVEWARPLLVHGAFHELLDEGTKDMDMYEMYRVMSAATQCTKRKPQSRPSISQVVTILRGENPCAGGGCITIDVRY